MSEEYYPPWSKDFCDECGEETLVSRTKPVLKSRRVLCSDCALYNKGYEDAKRIECEELGKELDIQKKENERLRDNMENLYILIQDLKNDKERLEECISDAIKFTGDAGLRYASAHNVSLPEAVRRKLESEG